MRDVAQRLEQLGLSVAEAALYDAIVQNDAAVLEMGDAKFEEDRREPRLGRSGRA